MKILNLYSGIGGNRKLWGNKHEITAVEISPEIAKIYKELFPGDIIVNGDAHQYLLENFGKFDFIWSSPPCQSHSSFRQNIGVRFRGVAPVFPDMRLYQEILFLKYNFKGKWVVENVKPYYTPLIKPDQILQRHFFWCNFKMQNKNFKKDIIRSSQIPDLEKIHGYNLSKFKIKNKRQILRNCVNPEIGEYVLQNVSHETLK